MKSSYRKIYEDCCGSIPLDENGRSYEIHHIDGDRKNNKIDNLIALSIEEHYNIHYQQGDWEACLLISNRMNISSTEKSKMASLAAKKRIDAGDNHIKTLVYKQIEQRKNIFFIDNPVYKQLRDGTHVSQNPKLIKNVSASLRKYNEDETVRKHKSNKAKELVLKGTHNFISGEIQRKMNKRRLEAGIHTTQQKWTCVCGVSGKGNSNYIRWHRNCKND